MSSATRVRVRHVIRETPTSCSFVLDADPTGLDYKPGQFVTVRIPSDQTGHVARSYSLSSSPHLDEPMKFTVKRTADGYASNWLCDNVAPGDELDLIPPAGIFTPHSFDHDLLLIAAGSGVTPVMSILKSALVAGTARVTLVYANVDPGSVIFSAELRELQARHAERLVVVHWLESVQGLPSAALLAGVLAPWVDREAFICGPAAFMEAARAALASLGVNHHAVHIEKFISLSTDPFDAPAPVAAAGSDEPAGTLEVLLDGTTHEFAWPKSSRLLDVLLEQGLDAPYSCREGACSACACIITEGEVDLAHNEVLDAADLEDGIILSCQAIATTDRVRVSFDE